MRKKWIALDDVKEIVFDLEEEFWHIINEVECPCAYKKAIKIKNLLLEELKLK